MSSRDDRIGVHRCRYDNPTFRQQAHLRLAHFTLRNDRYCRLSPQLARVVAGLL